MLDKPSVVGITTSTCSLDLLDSVVEALVNSWRVGVFAIEINLSLDFPVNWLVIRNFDARDLYDVSVKVPIDNIENI